MASLVASARMTSLAKRSLSLPIGHERERESSWVTELEGTLQSGGRIVAGGHYRVPGPTEGYCKPLRD